MKVAAGIVAATAILATAPIAHALCIYKGVDNAKTSLAQEFGDSKWVVRARVVTAADHWSDEDDSWSRYELDVVRAYKGRPPSRVRFFTYRNSGGFYMDRPWAPLPAGHDIGGEYLLFLNPIEADAGMPREASRAVFVNYSCGQSGPWVETSLEARRTLDRMGRRR